MPTGLLYVPAGCITNTEVASSAAISASKLVHQMAVAYETAAGSDVANSTTLVHVARGSGTLGAVKIATNTAPTGGDKAFTVDFKKSTGGGALSSMLSSVYTVDNSKASLTTYSATLGTSLTYAAGDILAVVVAVSGSTGNQGQGLCVSAFLEEATS